MEAARIPAPFRNTFAVWRAIFLREALDRFFGSRGAWGWQILEPIIQIAFFCAFYTYLRGPTMQGADTVAWIIVGILTFYLFRRTAIQTLHAVDCNRAFFAFRQVRPFDAAFARGSVEAFSTFLIASFCALIAMAIGKDMIPHNILQILAACFGMWLLGIGYGLVTAVIMRLIPDTGHIVNILMMPLYFTSGAIWPLTMIPVIYRKYILYNPLAHGVELVRMGFFTNYHHMDVSMAYLYAWVVGLFGLGIMLFRLMQVKLMTK